MHCNTARLLQLTGHSHALVIVAVIHSNVDILPTLHFIRAFVFMCQLWNVVLRGHVQVVERAQIFRKNRAVLELLPQVRAEETVKGENI